MIEIDRSDKRPLYEQIYNQLKCEISEGRYGEGKALKPVRVFSSLLGVSRNTVDLAYKQLLAEGYIYSKIGSGYYVERRDRYSTIQAEETNIVKSSLAKDSIYADDSLKKHHTDEEKPVYDFAYEHVGSTELEWGKWKKCVDESLYLEEYSFDGYENCKGDIELRHTINRYIYEHRGVKCEDRQIIICSGTLYAIDIALSLVQKYYNEGSMHSSVYCKEFNEPDILSLFENHGYTAEYTEADNKHEVSKTDIMYASPSHMHLLGNAMDYEERRRWLSFAAQSNIFIIENDCDSEFVYGRQRLRSMQSIEADNPKRHVIYVSSVSRILSPTVRIAFMVLPEELVNVYEKLYTGFRTAVPVLHQRTLALYIQKGYMDKHIRKLLKSSDEKYSILKEKLDEAVEHGLIEVPGVPAGGYISFRYISEKEETFGEYALRNGVKLYTERGYYKTGFLEIEESRISMASQQLLRLMKEYAR